MTAAAFVAASRIAADLVDRPEVEQHWADESACAGMTVGGLAAHLVGQLANTVRLLPADPGPEPPIPLLEHYARAAWVGSGADSEANTGIRESADQQASDGPASVRALARSCLEALPAVLAAPERPVLIPWQGWSLSRHDWLVTRLMETVVHSDDLAASIGVPTPDFPPEALTPVLDLLTALSVRRHGQAAVVRTLARAERAPGSIAAF